jgi:hypothetical protein
LEGEGKWKENAGNTKERKRNGNVEEKMEKENQMEETNKLGREAVGEVEEREKKRL